MRVPDPRANTFAQMTMLRSCFFSPVRSLPPKRCRERAGSAAAAGNMSRHEAAPLCMRACKGLPRPVRIARWSRPAYLRRRWDRRGEAAREKRVLTEEKACSQADVPISALPDFLSWPILGSTSLRAGKLVGNVRRTNLAKSVHVAEFLRASLQPALFLGL